MNKDALIIKTSISCRRIRLQINVLKSNLFQIIPEMKCRNVYFTYSAWHFEFKIQLDRIYCLFLIKQPYHFLMSYRVGKKYIYKRIFKKTVIIILEISIYTFNLSTSAANNSTLCVSCIIASIYIVNIRWKQSNKR